jgi:hypothetical protein
MESQGENPKGKLTTLDDFSLKCCILKDDFKNKITGETVEKVPKQILGGDAEKNDFTECATINDLTIMRGRETPKNQALTILKGFSTVSEVTNNGLPLILKFPEGVFR